MRRYTPKQPIPCLTMSLKLLFAPYFASRAVGSIFSFA